MNPLTLTKLNGYDCVVFAKPFWTVDEIHFAKCIEFDFNEADNTIVAVLAKTSKRSLFEFIKASFPTFSQAPLQKAARDLLYNSIAAVYNTLEADLKVRMEMVLPYYKQLYTHQVEAAMWAYPRQHNFLAMDPRLGKTLASISLSLMHNARRTLVICPATAKYNAWYRGLKKFGFNELLFTILDRTKKHSIKAFNERYVLVHYDMLPKMLPELLKEPFDHIIIDEAHKLKSIASQRFKNVNKIIKKNPKARTTLLSGTPIKNRVDDVYAYLKLIGHELGHNKNAFLEKYTVRQKYRVMGGKNLADLYVKLSNYMFRKRREDCLDIPKNNFLSYKFELDDYKTEYDKIIAEMAERKETGAMDGNIHSLNRVCSMAKIPGIIELANDILEQGKKVVIFGGYIDPLDKLEQHFGKKCVKIDGSVKPFERDRLIEKFTNNPKCSVFLGNSQAAGEAINLAAASDIIVQSLPFTPGELRQLIDRCIEIGKKEDTNIHLTFCQDSVDEYIYEILVDKASDINEAIDRGAGEVTYRSDMKELLMKKLLKKNDLHDTLLVAPIPEPKEESAQLRIVAEDNELPEFI